MMSLAVSRAGKLFPALLFLVVFFPSEVFAKGCMTGSCHQALVRVKYLHGPVAAEMAGVKACEMCHVPAGAKCTAKTAGKFTLKGKDLCQACHTKGTGSQHSSDGVASKCLKCHSPHGSDSSPQMLRVGVKSSGKKS
ncbi:MAG: hypothetical protein KKG47_14910 [Proteobacteria bacterium]|nr:hypothetical protein [Pseudomonadota bacterium]MBU1737295.1 hypothetical protein [Pseudomonadota bacterium]